MNILVHNTNLCSHFTQLTSSAEEKKDVIFNTYPRSYIQSLSHNLFSP